MHFKKLGIALAGGGGKGAYQIGVWKALRELGLDSHIAAVAGTSVGALNGAMLVQGRYEQAERMWRAVERHNLLTIESVPGLAAWLAQKAPTAPVLELLNKSIVNKGLFQREGLAAMIAEGVDSDLLAQAHVPLTVAWHHGRANQVVYQTLRDPATVGAGLMASAALPMIFDEVIIGDERYSDGGFYWGLPGKRLDNVPVLPLQQAGCDTVIVICLSQDDLTVAPQQFPGMRVIPLVPRRSLGNAFDALDFSNEGAARRIEHGYEDGRALLRHLEMFLSTEERYLQLWQTVAHSAAQEAQWDVQSRGVDRAHSDTVRMIGDFDKIVAGDRFDQPLAASDDDAPAVAELEATALLADLDRQRIHTNVDQFLNAQRHNRQAVESAVLDALAALAPVPGRADAAREQGTLGRLIGMLTGRNQKLAADNTLALAEGQYALLRLVQTVQQQGTMSLEFSCTLQNRLNAALGEMARQGQRQQQDLRRVYQSMASVYTRLRNKLMCHEEQLGALQRQGRLHHWLLHPGARRHRGLSLAEMAPPMRLATLANDFFRLTSGNWRAEELLSAEEMCARVGLDAPLGVGDFLGGLLADRESAGAVTQALVARPGELPATGAASWLLDLRSQRLLQDGQQAAQCWSYDPALALPAPQLLLELLYHMRAAGLAPVRHGSELAALKDRWAGQLEQLERLVEKRLLPAAFQREIAPVRQAIAGFRLKVPLVGKFSTGKSSLLNSWLDRAVQATELRASTAIPVELHGAHDGVEKLVVYWAGATPSMPPQVETFDDAYMDERRVQEFARGRVALHIERHCQLEALRRYPDLILVDTPGLGSINVEHDQVLAHYMGDGVVFILCANRGLVGAEELAFVRRQRQLGQQFSLLVCQEDLNNASQRQTVQDELAQTVGLDADALVRGCSAHEKQLAGFEDLLAHIESRKTRLFESKCRPLMEELLARAEHLLTQSASPAGAPALNARASEIGAAMAALQRAYQTEENELLADCRSIVCRSVAADVRSFLRHRRDAYLDRLTAQRDVSPLLVADAQNAFELAMQRHFGARLQRAGQALAAQASLGTPGTLNLRAGTGDTPAGGAPRGPDGSGFGQAVGTMIGGLVGKVIPVAGTWLGGWLGGQIGKLFGGGASERRALEASLDSTVEALCIQIEGQVARVLEGEARRVLAELGAQVKQRLDTERDNLEQIRRQLQASAQEQQQNHQAAAAALAGIRQAIAEEHAK